MCGKIAVTFPVSLELQIRSLIRIPWASVPSYHFFWIMRSGSDVQGCLRCHRVNTLTKPSRIVELSGPFQIDNDSQSMEYVAARQQEYTQTQETPIVRSSVLVLFRVLSVSMHPLYILMADNWGDFYRNLEEQPKLPADNMYRTCACKGQTLK